ncbi:dephospho-CoA kinase [Sphaerotilus microaerophilus]|uniref:Dephospho-CoA kinase n=1 Tax=Sphaerotilus microaerophilus TaxID=2914710 RepID=A0ABM7YJ49_9BURK|nr:dephospho-CoA kinase [Sphaerotilus sp. FB-5]BDI04252.1 dephospho-CoA kinase [Sphaerotilus sp. FB-5]
MSAAPTIRKIGLTGGIGSGKSTVANLLRDLGAWVIDSDAVAHELTAPGGAAIPAIAERFGAAAIDASGALDRAHMRERVFADPDARKALEAILHPMIGVATQAEADRAPADAPIVFDVPLLVESRHWAGRVERVLVVDCAEATQVQRVMQRNGWTAEAVERVIAQQASRSARRAVADAVIYNDGLTLAQLQAQVRSLWQAWIGPLPP